MFLKNYGCFLLLCVLFMFSQQATALSQTVNLRVGWNLISFTVLPQNKTPANVLSTLESTGALESIKAYDAAAKSWLTYPSIMPGTGYAEISTLDIGEAYWIKVASTATLVTNDSEVGLPIFPVSLQPGWNLFGFVSDTPQSYTSVFQGIDVQEIWHYDALSQQFQGVILPASAPPSREDFTNIIPGEGYLVHVTQTPNAITDFSLSGGPSPDTQITLNFTPSAGNEGIQQYNLHKVIDDSLAQANVSNGQSITGLNPNTTYDWYIRSVDTIGNSTDSNMAAFTTGQVTDNEAARFLTQSTFGTTFSDIDQVKLLGYEGWINEQVKLPLELHLPKFIELSKRMCFNLDPDPPPYQVPPSGSFLGPYPDGTHPYGRQQIWWQSAVESPDQLRQRVAFALSEIFVISDVSLGSDTLGITDYYDVFLENAFGNFRQLLEDVTLHPMMGEYLSHLRNQKADENINRHPDENYAREVLQLFSIGVHQLNLDGSVVKDVNNNPIPTYGQNEVKAFAKVFTGWAYHGLDGFVAQLPWYRKRVDSTVPMDPYDAYHDVTEKELLSYPNAVNQILPAGQDTRTDLEQALDNIFYHPNVGPFIGKQLIQRFITSNPSPAYIARVASVFNDNGEGVRGDMKAAIKAVLMDTEARAVHVASDSFGKLREPLIRFTGLMRAFGFKKITQSGQYLFLGNNPGCDLGSYDHYIIRLPLGVFFLKRYIVQSALTANSVFNFFQPNFAPQGPVANEGLVAPEFQLATEEFLPTTANELNLLISTNIDGNSAASYFDFSDEINWVSDYSLLLDKLDLLLLSGAMSSDLRGILLSHLNNGNFNWMGDEARLRDTIMLITNSSEYLIQQ